MASLSRSSTGLYTVQFVGGDGKRRSVRLGKVTRKTANEIKLKVEHLNALAVANLPMDGELASWVGSIGDDLAKKLAAVDLIPPRASAALRRFLDDYIRGRETDGHTKPATVVTVKRVADDLTAVFGAGADLRGVGAADAERFKRFYQDKDLAPATTYRRLKMARMLFGHAVKLKLIGDNPSADVRAKNVNPADRRHYVSEADTRRLLDAAAPAWRTVIALARFGGLRCPSEVLTLRWADVNLAAGRMVVTSPKTAYLEGKGERVVPVFARLRPYLEEAFELAAAGEEFVVGGKTGAGFRAASDRPGGWANANLRTTFEKIIRRAGLTGWPRLFQNLRSSLETDLMREHPIHVVTSWVGNTPKIALGHYLQTLDHDFEKAIRGGAESGAVAVQNAVQSPADCDGLRRTEDRKEPEISANCPSQSAGVRACPTVQMAKVGLEPTRVSPLDFESSASAVPPLGRGGATTLVLPSGSGKGG